VADVLARTTWTLTTPEGVPLEVHLGGIGERVTALLFDLLLLALALIAGGLLTALLLAATPHAARSTLLAVANLLTFLAWHGFFAVLELRGRGSTPGKRRLHLRVVARDGGPLTRGAVLARNLTRMVELTLPVQALLAPELLVEGAPAWAGLLASGWLLVFALVPLLHPENARVGDLLAGTRVIREPQAALLPDVARPRADQGPTPSPPGASDAASADDPDAERWHFTAQQLDLYGIREVQVLEDLLRRHEERASAREAAAGRAVCDAIRRKIAWPAPVSDADVWPFLRAFYRAQRAHLERELLLGRRREHKREGALAPNDR